VSRVIEGYRITLTYTLHRAAPPDPTTDALLMRATAFHEQVRAALADPSFMPAGERHQGAEPGAGCLCCCLLALAHKLPDARAHPRCLPTTQAARCGTTADTCMRSRRWPTLRQSWQLAALLRMLASCC
jgi:hypothetical protein